MAQRIFSLVCLPMNKALCRKRDVREKGAQRLELQEMPAPSWVGTPKVTVQGRSRGQIPEGLEYQAEEC